MATPTDPSSDEHSRRGLDPDRPAWWYHQPVPLPCSACGHDYAQHPAVYPRDGKPSRPCSVDGCDCAWFEAGQAGEI